MKIHVNGTGHDLFPFVSYDRERRAHRSAAEEWQPHQTGSVTYTDERGKPIDVDVSGTGWADRQWGNFATDQGW